MPRWLAELIWYKKTGEVHCMQRYIFKRSGLDSMGGGYPIFYLIVTGSAALIVKKGRRKKFYSDNP